MSWAIIAVSALAISTGTSLVSANQQRQAAKGELGRQERAAAKVKADEERNRTQAAMRLQKTRRTPATTPKPLDAGTALGGGAGNAGTPQGGKTLLGL